MFHIYTVITIVLIILLFSNPTFASDDKESGSIEAQTGVAQPAVVYPDRGQKPTKIKNEPSMEPVSEREADFQAKNKISARKKLVSYLKKEYSSKSQFPSLSRSRLLLIKGEALKALFPGKLLYALRFMQWPVAVSVPDGLSSNNIVAIDGKGKIDIMVNEEDLRIFFNKNLKDTGGDDAKEILTAWLWAAKEFAQDGMFQFQKVDAGKFKVVKTPDGISASGKVSIVPKGGNEGEVSSTILIDRNGKLDSVKMTKRMQPGIRPICQSHRLLDKDPVVRKMAERDILVMGKMAENYLFEERKKVSQPLQKAIDAIWLKILERENSSKAN